MCKSCIRPLLHSARLSTVIRAMRVSRQTAAFSSRVARTRREKIRHVRDHDEFGNSWAIVSLSQIFVVLPLQFRCCAVMFGPCNCFGPRCIRRIRLSAVAARAKILAVCWAIWVSGKKAVRIRLRIGLAYTRSDCSADSIWRRRQRHRTVWAVLQGNEFWFVLTINSGKTNQIPTLN